MDLTQKHCIPCEGGTPPLTAAEIEKIKPGAPGWQIIDRKKITREFKFKDFEAAMKFVNSAAKIAESEGHHPDIHVFYNQVRIELSTHAIGGLSENAFIMAAKINTVLDGSDN